jgi:bifunctional NMN adenylyltransferase/nudix hydrolase
MLRELDEETNIRVPRKVLKGSIKDVKFIDTIDRSERARVTSHAHLIELEGGHGLPEVRPRDDAIEAAWFSLGEFESMASFMFEDHFFIVKNIL